MKVDAACWDFSWCHLRCFPWLLLLLNKRCSWCSLLMMGKYLSMDARFPSHAMHDLFLLQCMKFSSLCMNILSRHMTFSPQFINISSRFMNIFPAMHEFFLVIHEYILQCMPSFLLYYMISFSAAWLSFSWNAWSFPQCMNLITCNAWLLLWNAWIFSRDVWNCSQIAWIYYRDAWILFYVIHYFFSWCMTLFL